jgi:hypothetical protein
MANLLAGRALAPEFLQGDCRPECLAPALLAYLDDPERVAAIQTEYARIHRALRRDAAASAARAVLELIDDSVPSNPEAPLKSKTNMPPQAALAESILIAGVDEAGRGPLAGPVCAAAVILAPARPIAGIDDSKKTQPRAP